MHVHDEIVMEMPEGKGSTQEVDKVMGEISLGKRIAAESRELRITLL
jgi:hypothetical protein